jgi:uncharacterized repeat protein (TIGR03803 family)
MKSLAERPPKKRNLRRSAKNWYSFTGPGFHPDGAYPTGVIRDATGNFYGTTDLGGVYLKGTVFKLSNAGVETLLRSFKARTDGSYPMAGVIRDAKGNLYGTAPSGGSTKCSGHGCGVVFKLDLTGTYSVLHRFTGKADGGGPTGGLAQDANGNLYGTNFGGGVHGRRTVFKLSKTGKLTVLHSMKGGADGMNPDGVIRDAKGNLYGTTDQGGDLSCGQGYGCGVVFKLTP